MVSFFIIERVNAVNIAVMKALGVLFFSSMLEFRPKTIEFILAFNSHTLYRLSSNIRLVMSLSKLLRYILNNFCLQP